MLCPASQSHPLRHYYESPARMTDFFNQAASQSYDEKNSKLAPIAENMHFLIRLVLQDLPVNARILCVGVGTGAEMFPLAEANPQWTFVSVDPSAAMLDVCRKRLQDAGMQNRCELVHGYVHDVAAGEHFDAALSILVGHFVKRDARLDFYHQIQQRLKTGGYLINTEISYDLDAGNFSSMLKNWERVQTLMGANVDSLKALPNALRHVLSVLPPAEVEQLIQESGIRWPVRFFQSFMIMGWYGQKE